MTLALHVGGDLPAAAAALRQQVFVGEQGVDPAVESDALDADPTTTHAVDIRDGVVAATGRLLDPGGTLARGRVGRMAVAPQLRGRGAGLAVLRALEAASRDRGLLGVDLHAQGHARGFYERAGYAPHGEAFHEQGIEHVLMRRTWLPGLRPVTDDDAEAVQRLIGGCWAAYDGCVLDVDGEEPWMRAPARLFAGDLWVVGDGGRVEACVGVRGDELKSLYVAAGARRRGWGAVLVRLAQRAGAVGLWTDSRFVDAHRLYERLGWVPTGDDRELDDLSQTVEWRYELPD